ncbi:MAG: hypothetical protein WD885_01845 [Candidatus Saccharimonadales bacterium]
MARKSKKSSKKVNDVSKPGETPASSNARPTITGHAPTVKNDPMVAFSSNDESKKDAKEKDNKNSYVSRSKAKIVPISDDFKSKKDVKESEEKEGSELKENVEQKDSKEDESPKQETTIEASESAAIDAIAQTADAKKAESKQEEEKKKHQEYIDGLVKEGKYRLPIIEGGHKGSAERLVSWTFLLLLIVSIGAYLAIDAGYIDIGFNLPFEFIKN